MVYTTKYVMGDIIFSLHCPQHQNLWSEDETLRPRMVYTTKYGMGDITFSLDNKPPCSDVFVIEAYNSGYTVLLFCYGLPGSFGFSILTS